MRLFSCFLLFIISTSHVNCKKSKAKYTINYNSIVKTCDGAPNEYIETKDLVSTRYNESIAVLDGPFTLKKGFASPTKLFSTIYRILPSGAEEIFGTHERLNLCDDIKERQKDTMIGQYLRAINFPDECPVPAGEYRIDNMVADTSQVPVKASLEGQYEIKFEFSSPSQDSGPIGGLAAPKDACLLFRVSIDKVT